VTESYFDTTPSVADPWLSVVMPTYNGAAYLTAALESVAAQADPGIEVIAVDDGSTDDTPDILRRYSERLPLRLVDEGRVGSWVMGANRGLGLARGAFVSFLHQDDMWMPGRLTALRREIDRTPSATLVVHDSWFVDAQGRRLGRLRCPLPPAEDLDPDLVVERLLVQNFVAIPSAAFNREIALEAGGMDESLWYTADWDLWLMLAARGVVRYLARPLSAYRVHGLAQTVIRSADSPAFLEQHETVLNRHLDSWRSKATERRMVESAARFSVEANVAFAAMANRQRPELLPLAGRFLRLGPGGWRRYVRDSRILERAGARVRAGIGRNGSSG
jgi:glycosyltransferase involved in cell wall biosynthesis